MLVKKLPIEKITELAARKNVKKIAVENFLASVDGQPYDNAMGNLEIDAQAYGWNAATQKAIRDGIEYSRKL